MGKTNQRQVARAGVTIPRDTFFAMQTKLCQLADHLDSVHRYMRFKKLKGSMTDQARKLADEGEKLSRYVGKYADRRKP